MSRTDSLDLVQRWFQSVVTNPNGVEEGIRSPQSQEWMGHREVQDVIRRSRRLTSMERLRIYANAYYARLIECMGTFFPILKRTLGAEVFDSFVLEYLQQYPSHSYTLDHLGDQFTRFLRDTRPGPQDGTEDEGWPDFLIDLATLEWTITRIFDGPGAEGKELLTPEILQAFPGDRFAESNLVPVVSFQLLVFRYPVSAYYTTVKRAGNEETMPLPGLMTERIAILRRDYIVRRYTLTDPQFLLLQKILGGSIMKEAISAAAETMNLDDNSLAVTLQSWFRDWSSAGFFAAITC